jgi:pimeloyl-ACP methyl ester carboxylesterase
MTQLFEPLFRQLDRGPFTLRSNAGHVRRSAENYYLPDVFVVPIEPESAQRGVHGGDLPAKVQFDLPYGDHSWLAHLARAGLDVFLFDVTGYGPSTRPAPMADPRNASEQQQALLIPRTLSEPCPPSYPFLLDPIDADVDDIAAVVDYLRALRGVDRVHLVGWSQGGRRAMAYAARYPDRVDRLVPGAPVYNPSEPNDPPEPVPVPGTSLVLTTRESLQANWDRMIGGEGQFDPGIREVIWHEMLETDPVGAAWGPGVVRRPGLMLWGANEERAAQIRAPTLLISGEWDDNSPNTRPEGTRQLYDDLGTGQRVFLDVACSSHYAIWEARHRLVFEASAEWLLVGSLGGMQEGPFASGTKW